MSDPLFNLHLKLADHAGDIAELFKPGSKVTIVVRSPQVKGDTGVVVTDDKLDAVIAELQRRKDQEEAALSNECRCAGCGERLKANPFMKSDEPARCPTCGKSIPVSAAKPSE